MAEGTTAGVDDAEAIDTAHCFCCGGTRGVPTYQEWLIPAFSYHVKCVDCGQAFNAKTGESNTAAFLLYLLCLLLGAAVGAGLYYVKYAPGS